MVNTFKNGLAFTPSPKEGWTVAKDDKIQVESPDTFLVKTSDDQICLFKVKIWVRTFVVRTTSTASLLKDKYSRIGLKTRLLDRSPCRILPSTDLDGLTL